MKHPGVLTIAFGISVAERNILDILTMDNARVSTYELISVERRLVKKKGSLEQIIIEIEPNRLNHLDHLLGMKPERKVWPSDNLLNGKRRGLNSKGYRRLPERRKF